MRQVLEVWNKELDQRFAALASWQLEQELRSEIEGRPQQPCERPQRAALDGTGSKRPHSVR
jgi:hypothetical protein